MKNDSYFRSDFIAKFINMNIEDFTSLSLDKVHFENDFRDLAEFLKTADTKIDYIYLKDCDIGNTQISKLICDCKNLKKLRELHLIKMNMDTHTIDLIENLQDHREL